MPEPIFYTVTAQVLVYIIVGIIAGIASFLTTMFRCVRKLDKRSFRQSTAIMTLASAMDRDTHRLHPTETPDIAKDVERQLKDTDGKL